MGAFLLLLPISHHGSLTFVDALFTSTSAVCVTGLIVKNTPVDFTIFGQMVIMVLIQIGGLGYMTAVTFLAVLRGKKIGYKDRLILKESLNYPGMSGVIRFLKIVFGTIVVIELVGALLLTLLFWEKLPFDEAMWSGLFHAVSAFNNAGFSLFEDNMIGYRSHWGVNLVLMAEILVGGIGYLVVLELYYFRRHQVTRVSTHSKLVLLTSGILIVLGIFTILSLEWNNPRSFGMMPWDEKILASLFLSVNYRTAGFNSIDLSTLTDANLFFSTFYMMVGGSPGGTAGGMKTTVLAVALIGVWYTLRGQDRFHIFRRSISQELVNRSYAIIFVATIYVGVSTVVLTEVDHLHFLRTLFEVCSAFGTVGLSTGDGGILSYSALFSDIGKMNIIVLMFMGRVGVFAFTVFVLGRAVESRIKYGEGKVVL